MSGISPIVTNNHSIARFSLTNQIKKGSISVKDLSVASIRSLYPNKNYSIHDSYSTDDNINNTNNKNHKNTKMIHKILKSPTIKYSSLLSTIEDTNNFTYNYKKACYITNKRLRILFCYPIINENNHDIVNEESYEKFYLFDEINKIPIKNSKDIEKVSTSLLFTNYPIYPININNNTTTTTTTTHSPPDDNQFHQYEFTFYSCVCYITFNHSSTSDSTTTTTTTTNNNNNNTTDDNSIIPIEDYYSELQLPYQIINLSYKDQSKRELLKRGYSHKKNTSLYDKDGNVIYYILYEYLRENFSKQQQQQRLNSSYSKLAFHITIYTTGNTNDHTTTITTPTPTTSSDTTTITPITIPLINNENTIIDDEDIIIDSDNTINKNNNDENTITINNVITNDENIITTNEDMIIENTNSMMNDINYYNDDDDSENTIITKYKSDQTKEETSDEDFTE
jgi:hypothetical protein